MAQNQGYAIVSVHETLRGTDCYKKQEVVIISVRSATNLERV